jgi:hypothetical protein
MSATVDPYAVPDDLAARFVEVKRMVEALQAPGAPRFFVMLVRYVIAGESYRASGLTASKTATPNLVQTQTGFLCDATFSPDLLSPAGRRSGRPERGGDITVRLEALLEDIIAIHYMGDG